MQLPNEIDTPNQNDYDNKVKKLNKKYWHETPCVVCGNNFSSLISRNQKSCSAKCSGVHVANSPGRIEKIKNTKFAKYGSDSFVNPTKAKMTCISKYGVDNASKSKNVIEKIKKTNQDRFGVDWTFQSENFIKKTKEFNKKNHGVDSVSQREDVKEKKMITSLINYGVDNPFKSEQIKNATRKTMLEKYGVEYPNQSKDIIDIGLNKKRREYYKYLVSTKKFTEDYDILFPEDEYINRGKDNLYQFRCKKCGAEFYDNFSNDRPTCEKCFPSQSPGTSEAEKQIYEFVKSITVEEILVNNRNTLPSGLELDVYIPSKKLAIEFNGLYWHSELSGKSKSYHLLKTNECEELGIHLIHIFEDEWKNKRDIVKAKILSKFNKEKRIGARELTIKKIPSADKNKFLIDNHIQGKDNSSIHYGAFYNQELVSVITFMKPRRALGNRTTEVGVFELVRFATSKPIVGILQKFIKAFKMDHSPTKLFSYADRRFTNSKNNIYNSVGFSWVSNTSPNYWYFKVGQCERKHRFSYRKSEAVRVFSPHDTSKTEWEIMKENGYNRIWDCGNIKYEMHFNYNKS